MGTIKNSGLIDPAVIDSTMRHFAKNGQGDERLEWPEIFSLAQRIAGLIQSEGLGLRDAVGAMCEALAQIVDEIPADRIDSAHCFGVSKNSHMISMFCQPTRGEVPLKSLLQTMDEAMLANQE